MRKVLFANILFSLFWISSQAQEIEIREITSYPNSFFQFNWSYNSFVDLPKDYDLSPFSMGIDAVGMYTLVGEKSPVSLTMGLGISANNYRSSSYIVDGDSTYFVKLPKHIKYSVNKLSLVYVDLPIEIRFRTRPHPPKRAGMKVRKRNFRLALGFKVGYNIQSYVKYDGDDFNSLNKESIKYKKYRIKNVNPFRYGVYVRVGYGKFSLYGFYSLSKLLKKDKGVDLQPYSLGLSVNF